MPRIVYVPPFSGLEPHERWLDDGNIRQQVGKAQPGSVLRNLLYRVIDRPGVAVANNADWRKIQEKVTEWFSVELLLPDYQKGISTEITVGFKSGKKTFDIIAGGSGFHQILTLLAFLYGYPEVTTILFDEPDAHLHVNLQRQIIGYFGQQAQKQFLIATHSEEFIKGVEIGSVLSMLSGKPVRVNTTHEILAALSEVDNIDVVRTQTSPFILYVEGEDDARLLAAWAEVLGKEKVFQQFYPYVLGGSTKKEMKEKAERHYRALKQLVPNVKRAVLLDYDGEEVAIRPPASQAVLNEWKRKNIDNYLLVPEAWKRAVAVALEEDLNQPSLFLSPYLSSIEQFFAGENLTLPPGASWRTVNAQIFKIVDGKKLLFEEGNSLFNQIKSIARKDLKINRTAVAAAMQPEHLHQDILDFFANLEILLSA